MGRRSQSCRPESTLAGEITDLTGFYLPVIGKSGILCENDCTAYPVLCESVRGQTAGQSYGSWLRVYYEVAGRRVHAHNGVGDDAETAL